MQGLPAKGGYRGTRLRPELVGLGPEAGAVDGITDERMADRGKVDPDLVGAAGLEPAGEQARYRCAVRAGVAFEHLPMGERRAAVRPYRHFVAGVRVTADRPVDRAPRPLRRPPDEGEVAATQGPRATVVGELPAQRLMRAVGLGDHHHPGGVLVEAMPEAGPLDAAESGQALTAMGDEGVDQRAAAVAGGGMDDQSGRLVDDDDLLVLEQHLERNRLGTDLVVLGGGKVERDGPAGVDAMAGIADRGSVDRDAAREDQRLVA